MLEVDELGLDATDRRLLETIIHKFGGGPVGLDTIAAATNEERDTIEDVYEPYPAAARLPAAHAARPCRHRPAYKHLGIAPPQAPDSIQQPLFSVNP